MHPHALYMPPLGAAKAEPDFPSRCSSPSWCALPAPAAATQKRRSPNIRRGNKESAMGRTGRQTETRREGDRRRILVVLSLSIPLSPGRAPKTCRQMLCFITLQKGTTGEHCFRIIIRTSKAPLPSLPALREEVWAGRARPLPRSERRNRGCAGAVGMRAAWCEARDYSQWRQRHQPSFSGSLGPISKRDECSVPLLKAPRTALWKNGHQRLHLLKNHLLSAWHWENENTSFRFISTNKTICLSSIIKINSAVVLMYLDIRVTIITEQSVTKLIAMCLHGIWTVRSMELGPQGEWG